MGAETQMQVTFNQNRCQAIRYNTFACGDGAGRFAIAIELASKNLDDPDSRPARDRLTRGPG